MESRKHERSKIRRNGIVTGTSQDNSFHDEGWGVEVQKGADVEVSRSQIRLHLGEVNVFECLGGLDLHDDLSLDKQIQAMNPNFLPFKQDAYFVLLREADATTVKGNAERVLVYALQKSRP